MAVLSFVRSRGARSACASALVREVRRGPVRSRPRSVAIQGRARARKRMLAVGKTLASRQSSSCSARTTAAAEFAARIRQDSDCFEPLQSLVTHRCEAWRLQHSLLAHPRCRSRRRRGVLSPRHRSRRTPHFIAAQNQRAKKQSVRPPPKRLPRTKSSYP